MKTLTISEVANILDIDEYSLEVYKNIDELVPEVDAEGNYSYTFEQIKKI
jgi:DNA-binding transcriptional MerR regulator